MKISWFPGTVSGNAIKQIRSMNPTDLYCVGTSLDRDERQRILWWRDRYSAHSSHRSYNSGVDLSSSSCNRCNVFGCTISFSKRLDCDSMRRNYMGDRNASNHKNRSNIFESTNHGRYVQRVRPDYVRFDICFKFLSCNVHQHAHWNKRKIHWYR